MFYAMDHGSIQTTSALLHGSDHPHTWMHVYSAPLGGLRLPGTFGIRSEGGPLHSAGQHARIHEVEMMDMRHTVITFEMHGPGTRGVGPSVRWLPFYLQTGAAPHEFAIPVLHNLCDLRISQLRERCTLLLLQRLVQRF